MRTYPKPMPEVIDPYKHITEKVMPLENVPSVIDATITDEGKISLRLKDKSHTLEPDEAVALARQIIEKASSADAEATRRAQVRAGLDAE